MGRIMRRIGTGSATQRVELGGTIATQSEVIYNQDGWTIAKSGNVYQIHLYLPNGITTAGVYIPLSIKPKILTYQVGKANDGADKWFIPFRITPQGQVTARDNANNLNIAVTWVDVSFIIIT